MKQLKESNQQKKERFRRTLEFERIREDNIGICKVYAIDFKERKLCEVVEFNQYADFFELETFIGDC